MSATLSVSGRNILFYGKIKWSCHGHAWLHESHKPDAHWSTTPDLSKLTKLTSIGRFAFSSGTYAFESVTDTPNFTNLTELTHIGGSRMVTIVHKQKIQYRASEISTMIKWCYFNFFWSIWTPKKIVLLYLEVGFHECNIHQLWYE